MKSFRIIFFYLIFSLTADTLCAQTGFYRDDSIPVDNAGTPLINAWAGGLNFCQFSAIDLNQDGIKDLFVFDRTGNKISTYINGGTANTVDYHYNPAYINKFPQVHDWCLLVDYNNDGKEDIFTYSNLGGGIMVYRNDADASGLKFTLVTPQVLSNYPGIANLYVSLVDVPAITDVDNDGDIDVLTYGLNFPNQVEFHKNLSMENYGVPDSLSSFIMVTNCFGRYSESGFDCSITLNSCRTTGPQKNQQPQDGMHAGSCLLCHDLNGDTATELIVGDLTCPTLSYLTNGGTKDTARYTGLDPTFPSSDVPVNLSMFPCAYYVDVNNDNAKDILASPNSMNVSENFNSIAYYKNTGTTNNATFNFQKNNFLQDQMIETGEGAYPVFFDYDNDGLTDLFIGNYGYFNNPGPFRSMISLYKNTGTSSNPSFSLITRDFANLSSYGLSGLTADFMDLDGDGDIDMLCGDYSGKLYFFEKQAGLPDNFVLNTANYKNSNGRTIDVGDFAVPRFVDLDRDGKKDLIIGSRNGKIAYLHNIGTIAASFDSITNFLGKVNVTKRNQSVTGYCYPAIYDSAGNFKLYAGTESGYIYKYTNIDGNLNGTFILSDSTYQNIREGTRTAPAIGDLTSDGKPDMILGNYAGGVSFYKGGLFTGVNEIALSGENIEMYPNPSDKAISLTVNGNIDIRTVQLEIYDLLGRKILSSFSHLNFASISTENLKNGIYLCKIILKDRIISTKFSVQH